jgi:hypothetical protein
MEGGALVIVSVVQIEALDVESHDGLEVSRGG